MHGRHRRRGDTPARAISGACAGVTVPSGTPGTPTASDADAVYLDLGVEGLGYMYVLSYANGGLTPAHYRLDVYTADGAFLCRTTGVAAARLAVDLFRNVYTLNYEPVEGSPRVEPSVSQWRPQTPGACPSNLPNLAAVGQAGTCAPATVAQAGGAWQS